MSMPDPPASNEPLSTLLERNGENGGETEPSFNVSGGGGGGGDDFTSNDDAGTSDRLSKFWMEALTLSCLKRASFQSSVEKSYEDAMSTSSLLEERGNDGDDESKRALHLDRVRKTIGGDDVCAYVAGDGTVINNGDVLKGGKIYKAAFCMRGDNSAKTSSGLQNFTDHQIETVARLSGLMLTGSSKENIDLPDNSSTAIPKKGAAKKSSASSGGWFQKITNGVTYAFDRVLAAYEGDEDCAGLVDSLDQLAIGAENDDVSTSAKLLLTRDVASTTNVLLDDEYDCAKGGATATMGEDHTLGNTDEVICISIVASVCQHLLSFSQQSTLVDREDDQENCSLFTLGGTHGGVERVMLYRKGWEACSFGSFCQKAGIHFSANQQKDTTANDKEKAIRCGKILTDISERELDLLGTTLCKSNYALIEKDVITLFPRGIPDNFKPCQTDQALFQIHVTKISIQNRMARLEQDANAAKQSAIKAQKNNTTKLALAHMRRRKVALEELERCATILTNLDASELRLDRAKNDVQIVQTYTQLRTALQGIRKSSENVDIENVEELMLDIREEMDDIAEIGREAIYPEVAIDEDELNEEFRLLELECEKDNSTPGAMEDDGEKHSAQNLDKGPLVEQQKEETEISKAKAVPA